MAKYKNLEDAVKSLGLEETIQSNISAGKGNDYEKTSSRISAWEQQQKAENARLAAIGNQIQKRSKAATEKNKWNMQKKKEDKWDSKASSPTEDATVPALSSDLLNYGNTILQGKDAKKKLEELDNQDYDWRDASARAKQQEERKRLEAVIAASNQEVNANRSARKEADLHETWDSLPLEDQLAIQKYATGRSVDYYDSLSQPLDMFHVGKTEREASDLYAKYGEQKVKDLADIWEREDNRKKAEAATESGKALANMGRDIDSSLLPEVSQFDPDLKPVTQQSNNVAAGILSSAASVPAQFAGKVGSLLSATRNLGNDSLDLNPQGNIFSTYANAVRGQNVENIQDNLGDGAAGKVAETAYQSTMQLADLAFSMLMTGGTKFGNTLLDFAGGFGQSVNELAQMGATPEQALIYGIGNAGVDALTGMIPFDNLLKTAKGGNVSVIKSALKQVVDGVTSEEASLFAGLLMQAAILQDGSEYNQSIQAMVANGATYEEAKAAANKEIWNQVLETAAVSGLTSAAAGAGAALMGNANNQQPEAETRKPEPLAPRQEDKLYDYDPVPDQKQSKLDEILDVVKPQEQQPVKAEAPSKADDVVNKTLEDIGLKKPSQDPVQNVDTQTAENYNEGRRSQTVQDTIDRLNAGGDSSPDINEILSIPEIAEAERANEGTPTFDLPNREKIREDGYRQAMQKGSWNGTDYTGEVNHDKRMDIVIGLPGSGKSSVYTERLSQEYKSRVIDTDDFREYIPEYNGSNASVVHEEASAIKDMALRKALTDGDNLLLSSIGANAKKLESDIKTFKELGYDVYLHLNELPNNKSMARAIGRYIGEDGSLGRYVSPKLIAEYGDKPTQTYLYLTGQGGTGNGRLGSDLRTSRGQNIEDAGGIGEGNESRTNHQGLLAGYDWYNNDVARGEAPKLIQTSEQTTAQSAPQVDTPRISAEGGQPVSAPTATEPTGQTVSGDVDTSTLGKQSAPSGDYADSKSFTNSGAKSADADVRGAYDETMSKNPSAAKYEVKHDADVDVVAKERTATPEKVRAEADYLITKKKNGMAWTAEDELTATYAIKELFRDGSDDAAAKYTELQEAMKRGDTNYGQVLHIKKFIGTMKDIESPMTAADTFCERMYGMKEKDTTYNPKKSGGRDFETWRNDVVKNVAKIAADIDKVPDGDTAAMKAIIEDIAFQSGISQKHGQYGLPRGTKKTLDKVSFEDLKILANAQVASMSDVYRKRSASELAESSRKSAMLSAITTFERNLTGNTAIGLLDSASDSTSARIMDGILSKFTGKQTVGNDIKNIKQYVQGAMDAARWASLCVELNVPVETDAMSTLNTAIDGGNGGKYVGKTFTPDGNVVMRGLYAYQKFQSYELDVSDKIFEGGTKSAVSESLKNLKGLSADEQQRLADYTANRRTFKDATWTDENGDTHGAVASRAGQFVKNGAINLSEKGGEIVGGVFGKKGKEVGGNVGKAATSAVVNKVAPFVSVPTNVAQAGVDYSTGIIKGAAEMAAIIHDARNGIDIPVERQRQAASDFGRGVSGLGLIGIAAAAAKAGIIAVHNDDDLDKKSLEQSEGLSGAQINLSALGRLDEEGGEKWRSGDVITSLDFLEPFNTHLYLGAELAQYDDMWSLLKNYSGSVFDAALQAFTDSPMVSGLQELQDDIDGIKEGSKSFGDFAAENIGEYVSSYEPQIVRQAAQAIDGYYRDTRGDNAVETALNQLIAGIPGLSMTLPKKVDGLGNEQKRPGWLSTFFDPTKTKTYNENEVATYLSTLSDSTGSASFYPDRQAPKKIKIGREEIQLDGQQREAYQKAYGDSVNEMFSTLMHTQGFQSLPDDVQVDALNKAKSYATEIAKASIAENPDAPEKTAKELAQGIYKDTVKNNISNAFKSISEDAKYGRDNADSVAALEQAYRNVSVLPDDMKKEIMEDSGGRVGYYAAAKEAGVSTEKFLDLYQQYQDIDKKDASTSEKAQQWAVALDKAKRSGILTSEQKNVLKDKMNFRYSMVAETVKYDEMVDSGISIEKADKIIDVIDSVFGTGSRNKETGAKNVRAVDKYAAIAKVAGLSDDEIDAAMKIYMPDYDPEDDSPNKTYLKYEYARQQLELSPEEFIDIYNVYLDGGKKAEAIAKWKDLGYDSEDASTLYKLFKATGKKKIDVESWYADQVGQRDASTRSTTSSNNTYSSGKKGSLSFDDYQRNVLAQMYGTAE